MPPSTPVAARKDPRFAGLVQGLHGSRTASGSPAKGLNVNEPRPRDCTEASGLTAGLVHLKAYGAPLKLETKPVLLRRSPSIFPSPAQMCYGNQGTNG